MLEEQEMLPCGPRASTSLVLFPQNSENLHGPKLNSYPFFFQISQWSILSFLDLPHKVPQVWWLEKTRMQPGMVVQACDLHTQGNCKFEPSLSSLATYWDPVSKRRVQRYSLVVESPWDWSPILKKQNQHQKTRNVFWIQKSVICPQGQPVWRLSESIVPCPPPASGGPRHCLTFGSITPVCFCLYMAFPALCAFVLNLPVLFPFKDICHLI